MICVRAIGLVVLPCVIVAMVLGCDGDDGGGVAGHRRAAPPASGTAQTDTEVQEEPGEAPYADRPETLWLDVGDGVTMELVLIPAGEFMMGANDAGTFEKPAHRVRITRPFYMGKYEVTQQQYEAVMGKNLSRCKGARNPVETVSWNDASEFCRRLSARTGQEVRLPAEAEWEYACRAGSRTRFCFGDSDSQLGEYAWYGGNSGRKTHPVGQKRPNPWGLYDMHGNVWEWCLDWYDSDYYEDSPPADPRGPSDGTSRVLRGGAWGNSPRGCHSAHRFASTPTFTGSYLGFRVVVLPGPS